jgi:hypothetical protein
MALPDWKVPLRRGLLLMTKDWLGGVMLLMIGPLVSTLRVAVVHPLGLPAWSVAWTRTG